MNNTSINIAKQLLQIYAIKLNPASPFTWASGLRSPIYCDNRQTLSYPDIRASIKNAFVDTLAREFPNVELIAGVATGGIAIGAILADALNLPFIYVRTSAKQHGLGNQIEGFFTPGQKTVVIEDLISTGSSSLQVVDVLRGAGVDILGMVSIFSYGFQRSVDNFAKADCKLFSLSNYQDLLLAAIETGYIGQEQLSALKSWSRDPEAWSAQFKV